MVEFLISSEIVPTNKSSKYDEVITAIKGLADGQHLQVNNEDVDKAVDTSNAIRSAAKGRGIKLNITKRGSTLYIKEKKS